MVTRKMKNTRYKELTAYERSINRYCEYEEKLALGWRSVFRDSVKKLRAVVSDKRAQTVLEEPFVIEGELVLIGGRNDKVVSGILRKAEAVLRKTCSLCGKPASKRGRELGYQVLCSGCAGLRAMQDELITLFAILENGDLKRFWPESTMSAILKELVDENSWIVIGCPVCPCGQRIVTFEAMLRQRARFEIIQKAVNEKLEAGC